MEASESIGPPICPNATLPQGKPPKGNDDRAHSTATQVIANHSGPRGKVVVRTARIPNSPVYRDSTMASATHGSGPT
jgi:hypothetical protein